MNKADNAKKPRPPVSGNAPDVPDPSRSGTGTGRVVDTRSYSEIRRDENRRFAQDWADYDQENSRWWV